MNTFEPAQLDNVCPHPIKSKELLKWTSLDKLEHDFALFRDETNRLDTRIKIGLKAFKKPPEDKCRELADIFVIPAEAEVKTATDIIDIRLCANIRALEFILREMSIVLSHDRLVRLLNSLSRPPSIICSFEVADDTQDVRWFFKNRVMIFILRASLIRYRNYQKDHHSLQLFPDYERFTILENPRLHIDEDDCDVIMMDIVFMSNHNGCQHCYDICQVVYDVFGASCQYLDLMQSLAGRHRSLLERSIQFSMEQLPEVDRREQARRLLYILFRVAHNRKKWKVINTTLARLLSDPTTGIRAFAIRLFAKLVEWTKSREGTSFEMLSEHFSTMIELLESPSNEIQSANHYAWWCIGRSKRVTPREYQLLRTIVSSYLKRVERITHSGPSRLEPEGIRKGYEPFCWLIMPKMNDSTGEFDFTLASDQLFEDLNIMTQNEVIPYSFYDYLESVSEAYRRILYDGELTDQFDLIRDRASWLMVKQLSANSLRGSQDRERLKRYVKFAFSGYKTDYDYLSPTCYPNYCKILLEIRQCFYNRDQILEPHRYLWFLRVFDIVGSRQDNKEKSKAFESCLLRAIEIYPKWKSRYLSTVNELSRFYFSRPLSPICSLDYHDSRIGRKVLSAKELCLSSNDMQGIQARRILLVSLCKYSIVYFDDAAIDYIPKMIDLMGELELAYKLKAEEIHPEQDEDVSLLPSCVELAFPTPFDDTNNQMYICEFAYFRDTMDYLRRNEPRELDRVCSLLPENKNERLNYYQNQYDKFDDCCSTRSFDRERDRFQCIEHKIEEPAEPQICPLLNRYQYRDCIENKNS